MNHEATKDMKFHEVAGTYQTPRAKARARLVSNQVIGAAIEVHRHLGPGLLESVYEACLAEELRFINVNPELLKDGLRRLLNG